MAEVQFCKYHGAGNDFIFIDNRDNRCVLSNDQRKKMCDRHFGIGADGLLEIKLSEKADFKLLYFNSDGREGTLCGNGSRCAVAFALKIGVNRKCISVIDRSVECSSKGTENGSESSNRSNKPEPNIGKSGQEDVYYEGKEKEYNEPSSRQDYIQKFTFEAFDGIHTGGVSELITMHSCNYSNTYYVDMKDIDIEQIKIHNNGDVFVNTGSPHHVTFAREALDIVKEGRELRYRLYGPEGCNINFVSKCKMFLNDLEVMNLQIRNYVDTERYRNNRADETPEVNCTTNCTDVDTVNCSVTAQRREDDHDKEINVSDTDNIIEDDCLYVRTYERGVENETLACGTGCVAVAIADYVTQMIKIDGAKNYRKSDNITLKEPVTASRDVMRNSKFRNDHGESVEVNTISIGHNKNKTKTEKKTILTRGGCLLVTFNVKDLEDPLFGKRMQFYDIKLSGPVEHVFTGVYVI